MKSSLFPDVNVWLALSHSRHVHHPAALNWFQRLENDTLFFCRFTQLGFLRLLTNDQVMGIDVMSQRGAWGAYLRWFDDERIEFHREPEAAEFERLFQQFSTSRHSSPKLWADAYLAAFASSAGLHLVTFDQALPKLGAPTTVLL